jgi:hypothetical protein
MLDQWRAFAMSGQPVQRPLTQSQLHLLMLLFLRL